MGWKSFANGLADKGRTNVDRFLCQSCSFGFEYRGFHRLFLGDEGVPRPRDVNMYKGFELTDAFSSNIDLTKSQESFETVLRVSVRELAKKRTEADS